MSTYAVGVAPSSSTIPDIADEQDRISTLPDHILLHILERLRDYRAAIQARTLSRRWLWVPLLLSYLVLDIADFLPCGTERRKHWTIDQAMTAYTTTLTRLLRRSSSSAGHAVKDIQLSFYLTDPYLQSIGHAVGDLMERGNTDYLDITILVDTADPSYEQCILFGQRFMAFLQACPNLFRWLTRLTLHNITFGDSDISSLLNTCNKLELLSLTYCDSAFDPATGEDSALTINAPHSSLLALEIRTCEFSRIELIHAPKLGRLVYSNWTGSNPPLHFGNVPCLHNIALCCAALNWQMPFRLSHCLSNTTTLSIMYLDFIDQMIWVKPEEPSHLSLIFKNLTYVYLCNIFYQCDLDWTLFILHAAPSLKNLYLKLSRHSCESFRCEDSAKRVNVPWDQASSDLKHNHLRLLEITSFVFDEKLMKYIELVMRQALVLKRIHLLDQQPCARCDAMENTQSPSPMRWRFPMEEEKKKLIRQQLLDGVSSSVEISIGK